MASLFLHLDMDAFFASVEQASDIRLKGRPVIVGARGRKYQTVVAACSYEAKRCGVESGMPSAHAFRLCPGACFVPADSAKYMDTSEKILCLLETIGRHNYPQPLTVELASIDEFFLDISNFQLSAAEILAQKIRSEIKRHFHITGSIGIAPTRILSKMVAKSKKPDGLKSLPPEEIAGFLKDRPVEKIPGVGQKTKKYLNEMGLRTCGQLAETSVAILTARFGKIGQFLADVVRGRDRATGTYWQNDAPAKSVGHSYTFEKEITQPRLASAWIRLLSEMVAYRLRKSGRSARRLSFYIQNYAGLQSRQKKFSTATADPAEITRRAGMILISFRPRYFYIKAMGVCAYDLEPAQQLELFIDNEKRRNLIQAVDAINDRWGDWTIYPGQLKEIK